MVKTLHNFIYLKLAAIRQTSFGMTELSIKANLLANQERFSSTIREEIIESFVKQQSLNRLSNSKSIVATSLW
jgi:hypothetical protein